MNNSEGGLAPFRSLPPAIAWLGGGSAAVPNLPLKSIAQAKPAFETWQHHAEEIEDHPLTFLAIREPALEAERADGERFPQLGSPRRRAPSALLAFRARRPHGGALVNQEAGASAGASAPVP
jgi:hypothetical protein